VLAGRAVQLVEWWRTSRFCGRCGSETTPAPDDRSMRCGRCGLAAYPRLAPAIIVLVRRGDRVLLAQGSGFRGTYSTLAGFVEPGESLEDTVAREVFEECGVRVHDIAYASSQPWPFPSSLMLGFRAKAADPTLKLDPAEILEADWYTRDFVRGVASDAPLSFEPGE